tara:strand:- start:3546 stop:3854 length:309 start_codon:yes stop_codon:yes gene_type:complete
MDAINNVDLDTLKDYLRMLNMFDAYDYYLQEHGKNDSITTIKNYFNNYIFISIRDFHEENYDKLHNTRADLMRYIQEHPDRKASKKIVKKEKTYKIFLRLLR